MATTSAPSFVRENGFRATILAGLGFLLLTSLTSIARWANFEYRTFDLAYYVQGIWQLLHGRWEVSVEHVPLLGNHVEPIIFLFAPFFAVLRHPMLFVVVQNALVATMAPVGYACARRLGITSRTSCLLGIALLVTPAAGYIALHEFHPEALAAPFLLLLIHAHLAKSLPLYWLWFVAVLACKENMAVLLAAFCVVQGVIHRKRPHPELFRWYLGPLFIAAAWFFLCVFVVTPRFNAGNIGYFTLYERLGSSPREILANLFLHPFLWIRAVLGALRHGNLVWGLLLPFLFLPLLRPRWLLVGAPVLLQHLLSWRSSEWTIYFHYAAPLLPLFWIAMAEAVASGRLVLRAPQFVRQNAGWGILIACAGAQCFWGPAGSMAETGANWFDRAGERKRKQEFVNEIPAHASVVAPLPYLSHLAKREKLYSLHYILKGLKTLSHENYEPPPPTDYVLIDYGDTATFDAGAGYYHPTMKTRDGRVIPSSDRLLHEFLRGAGWIDRNENELTLLRRDDFIGGERGAKPQTGRLMAEIGTHSRLTCLDKSVSAVAPGGALRIGHCWEFAGEREVFPWMLLRLSLPEGGRRLVAKGLCVPEATQGFYLETWNVRLPGDLPVGDYEADVILLDQTRRAWHGATGGGDVEAAMLCPPLSLGRIRVQAPRK